MRCLAYFMMVFVVVSFNRLPTVLAQSSTTGGISCADGICRSIDTSLPLRILPRAFSQIYNDQRDDPTNVKFANIDAFKPLYVVNRVEVDFSDPNEAKGWYEVSAQPGGVSLGWMHARDVLEWRQPIVLSYTHPGTAGNRRSPVLMFDSREGLDSVAVLKDEDRAQQVEQLLDNIKNGSPVNDIISMEPYAFIDIDKNFYLLPVIQFEENGLGSIDAKYLQLAAATKERSAPGQADTLQDPNYREEALDESLVGAGEGPEGVDLVFVSDMTNSMTPYINATVDAMRDISTETSQFSNVHYGIAGYQDSIEIVPGLDFTSKIFTKDLIADANAFADLIQTDVKVAQQGSEDYQEEVFAGMKAAIDGINWRTNSLKVIVHFGDASSHPPGHAQNTTGLDAKQIRDLANASQITILSVHLKDPRAAEDHPIAAQQFRFMARNEGVDTESYLGVDVRDQAAFGQAVRDIARTISKVVDRAQSGELMAQAPSSSDGAQSAGNSDDSDTAALASQLAQEATEAALVTYVGNAAKPPKDLTAWVVDRDLSDPTVPTFDTRLLVSRTEMDNLARALSTLSQAFAISDLTNQEFFTALTEVLATAHQGQDISVEKAQQLGDSGLLPRWLDSLPYKSFVLSLSAQAYEAMDAKKKKDLEQDVKAKLALYETILQTPDRWIQLNEGDDEGDYVYPLKLASLP